MADKQDREVKLLADAEIEALELEIAKLEKEIKTLESPLGEQAIDDGKYLYFDNQVSLSVKSNARSLFNNLLNLLGERDLSNEEIKEKFIDEVQTRLIHSVYINEGFGNSVEYDTSIDELEKSPDDNPDTLKDLRERLNPKSIRENHSQILSPADREKMEHIISEAIETLAKEINMKHNSIIKKESNVSWSSYLSPMFAIKAVGEICNKIAKLIGINSKSSADLFIEAISYGRKLQNTIEREAYKENKGEFAELIRHGRKLLAKDERSFLELESEVIDHDKKNKIKKGAIEKLQAAFRGNKKRGKIVADIKGEKKKDYIRRNIINSKEWQDLNEILEELKSKTDDNKIIKENIEKLEKLLIPGQSKDLSLDELYRSMDQSEVDEIITCIKKEAIKNFDGGTKKMVSALSDRIDVYYKKIEHRSKTYNHMIEAFSDLESKILVSDSDRIKDSIEELKDCIFSKGLYVPKDTSKDSNELKDILRESDKLKRNNDNNEYGREVSDIEIDFLVSKKSSINQRDQSSSYGEIRKLKEKMDKYIDKAVSGAIDRDQVVKAMNKLKLSIEDNTENAENDIKKSFNILHGRIMEYLVEAKERSIEISNSMSKESTQISQDKKFLRDSWSSKVRQTSMKAIRNK